MTSIQATAAERRPSREQPKLSIVIPTYNEAGNVEELVAQLVAAIPADLPFEVLFVDDSTDDTPKIISEVARHHDAPISVQHRDVADDGLGGAVIEGLRAAKADWVVVMDGDLQHPPALVPELLATGLRTGADLVLATRYAEGGGRGGLTSCYRHMVSHASTLVAKLTFPRLLRTVSDPMSGFFAVRRGALELDHMKPLGFKILIELIVRGGLRKIAEVPFEFGERFAGESKPSLREGVRFLRHLGALRLGDSRLHRTVAFGVVGLTGFLPNLGVLWLLTGVFDMHYAIGTVVATQIAILWNFQLIDLFVFPGHRRCGRRRRLASFVLLNNADLVFRIPLLAFLVEYAGMGVLAGTVVTLLAAFFLRFIITDRVIYLVRHTARPHVGVEKL